MAVELPLGEGGQRSPSGSRRCLGRLQRAAYTMTLSGSIMQLCLDFYTPHDGFASESRQSRAFYMYDLQTFDF
jgi:hypothetical protein